MGGYLGPAVFLDFTPKYSYISKGIDLVEDGEYHGSFFFTIGPNLTMSKFVGKGQANLEINYGIQAEIGYQINIDNLYIKPAITLWANDYLLKNDARFIEFVGSSFTKTLLNTISVYFRF
nr:MAG: hypothetical protein CR965_01445 [Paludibacter sp.]